MLPPDTVLLWRFKDLAAYDLHETPTAVEGVGTPVAASRVLGAEVNLPNLPGIDPARPLLDATLDSATRADARLLVLPVADRSAVERAFSDPELLERHARHVEVHGDWAAAGWDLLAVRRAGRGGGPWPKERGEEWCAHAEWPGFVDHCLRPEQATQPTVAAVLAAFGYDVSSGHSERAEDGTERWVVDAGRVPWVRDAWKTVTVWGFTDRVRAELVPAAETELVPALSSAVPSPPDADLVAAVAPQADARLRLRGAQGRKILALALWYAGVPWPKEAYRNGFAALRWDAPGGIEVVAERARTELPFWNLAWLGRKEALPDPQAFGLPAIDVGAAADLQAGAAKLTAAFGGTAPAGTYARRAFGAGDGVEVHAVGSQGKALAERIAASGVDGDAAKWPDPPPPDGPGGKSVLLASFRLSWQASQFLLGRAVSQNGILSPLQGGSVEGTLSTDGVRLILDARRGPP